MFSVFFVFDPMQLFKLLFKANHGTPFFFLKLESLLFAKLNFLLLDLKLIWPEMSVSLGE